MPRKWLGAVRKWEPGAQLRDRDIDGPDPGVEVAVAVAVALRGPARAGLGWHHPAPTIGSASADSMG
jgi:hypothetical protein